MPRNDTILPSVTGLRRFFRSKFCFSTNYAKGLFSVTFKYTVKLSNIFPPSQVVTGLVDCASVTKTVDLGSIPDRVKPKTITIGIHNCLTFSIKWQNVKPPSCVVVDRREARWQVDSKIRCSWPRQLGE